MKYSFLLTSGGNEYKVLDESKNFSFWTTKSHSSINWACSHFAYINITICRSRLSKISWSRTGRIWLCSITGRILYLSLLEQERHLFLCYLVVFDERRRREKGRVDYRDFSVWLLAALLLEFLIGLYITRVFDRFRHNPHYKRHHESLKGESRAAADLAVSLPLLVAENVEIPKILCRSVI